MIDFILIAFISMVILVFITIIITCKTKNYEEAYQILGFIFILLFSVFVGYESYYKFFNGYKIIKKQPNKSDDLVGENND